MQDVDSPAWLCINRWVATALMLLDSWPMLDGVGHWVTAYGLVSGGCAYITLRG
jgi:hypothetical protein